MSLWPVCSLAADQTRPTGIKERACRAYGLPARASPATGRLCKQKRPSSVDTLAFPQQVRPHHINQEARYHARPEAIGGIYLSRFLPSILL
ncbi:MAG: hypothetical protein K6A62_01915 [Bacteroidales bacterium]|nr:hypothetical protein [Bacteroidales bacterium]